MKMTETTAIKYDLRNAHGYASGAQTCLYLIPAAESSDGQIEIYMDVQIGSGTPMPAWHRRWYCLGSVGTSCEPESLQNALEQFEDEFREINAAYKGSEWDGSNQIGKWDRDAMEESNWDRIAMSARENCNPYWDASDWFQGSLSDIDLTKESVTAIAEYESGTADGAVLDATDCESFLRNAISERIEEIEYVFENGEPDDDYREELDAELSNLKRLIAA
jgi:hypothetical protein